MNPSFIAGGICRHLPCRPPPARVCLARAGILYVALERFPVELFWLRGLHSQASHAHVSTSSDSIRSCLQASGAIVLRHIWAGHVLRRPFTRGRLKEVL